MTKLLTALLFSIYGVCASGQNAVNNYFPKEFWAVDVSMKKQKELERQNQLLEKQNLTYKEQRELDKLLEKYGEAIESVWDIIDGGCSWYCGGGNYEIRASSSLPDSNGISYSAKSANDLSYRTAWIAGNDKGGVGEYLEYFFKNESPRITRIIVSNGYMKNAAAWKNNNRVKKLRLFVNDKLYGILNLEDSDTDQIFQIGTFGLNENGTDLILRFEIFEVYKGDKDNDTAITEIYFDGIDVH